MWFIGRSVVLRAVFGALLMALGPGWAHAAMSSAMESGKICMGCHEGTKHKGPLVPLVAGPDGKPEYAIWHNKHGVKADARTPAANGGCGACHGDLSEHVRSRGKIKPSISFDKDVPAEEKNAVCLKCHESGARIYWQGSIHDRNQTACTDCHNPHMAKDQVLVKQTQAGVCFSCHKDIRADSFRFSGHPIRSGEMDCSDCHAPHGSTSENLLKQDSVNETCYQCHADKRGPYLWEHDPVREECTNCHNPHGTNTAPMLKVRQPFLCQQCHQGAYHPATLYDNNQLLGRPICTNCHTTIHGSNHPSGQTLLR